MKRPLRNEYAGVQNSTSVDSVCTALELKQTRSNTPQEEPVNIAYGLYVSTIHTAVFINQTLHNFSSRSSGEHLKFYELVRKRNCIIRSYTQRFNLKGRILASGPIQN